MSLSHYHRARALRSNARLLAGSVLLAGAGSLHAADPIVHQASAEGAIRQVSGTQAYAEEHVRVGVFARIKCWLTGVEYDHYLKKHHKHPKFHYPISSPIYSPTYGYYETCWSKLPPSSAHCYCQPVYYDYMAPPLSAPVSPLELPVVPVPAPEQSFPPPDAISPLPEPPVPQPPAPQPIGNPDQPGVSYPTSPLVVPMMFEAPPEPVPPQEAAYYKFPGQTPVYWQPARDTQADNAK